MRNTPSLLSGSTANRPTNAPVGLRYTDTDLGIPVYWNGTAWEDGVGGPADFNSNAPDQLFNIMLNPRTSKVARFDGVRWVDSTDHVVPTPFGRTITFTGDVTGSGSSSGFPLTLSSSGLAKVSVNLDGGSPSSIYGGTVSLDAGGP